MNTMKNVGMNCGLGFRTQNVNFRIIYFGTCIFGTYKKIAAEFWPIQRSEGNKIYMTLMFTVVCTAVGRLTYSHRKFC